MTSHIWIALSEEYMTSVIEEIHLLWKAIGHRVREPYLLKTRYNHPLQGSKAELHAHCLSSLKYAQLTDSNKVVKLEKSYICRIRRLDQTCWVFDIFISQSLCFFVLVKCIKLLYPSTCSPSIYLQALVVSCMSILIFFQGWISLSRRSTSLGLVFCPRTMIKWVLTGININFWDIYAKTDGGVRQELYIWIVNTVHSRFFCVCMPYMAHISTLLLSASTTVLFCVRMYYFRTCEYNARSYITLAVKNHGASFQLLFNHPPATTYTTRSMESIIFLHVSRIYLLSCLHRVHRRCFKSSRTLKYRRARASYNGSHYLDCVQHWMWCAAGNRAVETTGSDSLRLRKVRTHYLRSSSSL